MHKRLYVHDSVYDALCDEIAALASAAVVGDGHDPQTQFGPVQNRMQFEKACSYVTDAKANGRIIADGDIPEGPGFFVPLTVVRDIQDGSRVVDEEPFGPVWINQHCAFGPHIPFPPRQGFRRRRRVRQRRHAGIHRHAGDQYQQVLLCSRALNQHRNRQQDCTMGPAKCRTIGQIV